MDLFNKAELWFVAHYRNLNTIQLKNDSTGRIIGVGSEIITINDPVLWEDNTLTYNAHITLQIDCKDGKYRCNISSIVIKTPKTSQGPGTAITTAEDLMNDLIGKNNNPVIFNKTQSKRLLKSLNNVVNGVMLSLNQSVNSADDF